MATATSPLFQSSGKYHLYGFRSFHPYGIASSRWTDCPAWFILFLFALLPAFHFREKILNPLPAFPLTGDAIPP